MANYLTEFATLADYQAAKENLNYPNVSLIDADGSLIYEKTAPPHNYSKDYFTIVSEADNNTIGLTKSGITRTISASTDDGQTWSTYSSGNIATLNTGDKILLKFNGTFGSYSGYYTITATAAFHAEGNILSLMYGDNFSGQTSASNYAFRQLFYRATTLTSAENLIFPRSSYAGEECYNSMFFGCTSLTTAPELPATTLYSRCYKNMFYGCSSLNYIKCLATNISASQCTDNWVNGVASSGTFVKDPNMSSWTTGNNGIPNGWTVEDAL